MGLIRLYDDNEEEQEKDKQQSSSGLIRLYDPKETESLIQQEDAKKQQTQLNSQYEEQRASRKAQIEQGLKRKEEREATPSFGDTVGAIAKNVKDVVINAFEDKSFTAEEKEARSRGEIVKPHAINMDDETYRDLYAIYKEEAVDIGKKLDDAQSRKDYWDNLEKVGGKTLDTVHQQVIAGLTPEQQAIYDKFGYEKNIVKGSFNYKSDNSNRIVRDKDTGEWHIKNYVSGKTQGEKVPEEIVTKMFNAGFGQKYKENPTFQDVVGLTSKENSIVIPGSVYSDGKFNEAAFEMERKFEKYRQGDYTEFGLPLKPGVALEHYQESLNTINQFLGDSEVDRSIFQGLRDATKNKDWFGLIPFFGSVKGMGDTANLSDALDKYDEKGFEGLGEDEQSMITRYRSDTIGAYIDRGGADIGTMLAQIPKFVVEMAATGGIVSGGKKVVGGVLSKTALSGTKAAKYGTAIAGTILGETARSGAFIPTISESLGENMLPNYGTVVGDDGKVIIGKLDDGDDFDTALKKAWGSQLIEQYTEQAGAVFEKPVALFKKQFVSKFMSKIVKENTQELGEAGAKSLAKQLMEKGGWNGIIGEVMEEEIGEPFSAALDEREYQAPFITREGTDRFWTEFMGIGIMGGITNMPANVVNTRYTQAQAGAVKGDVIGNEIMERVNPNLKETNEALRDMAADTANRSELEGDEKLQLKADLENVADYVATLEDGTSDDFDMDNVPENVQELVKSGKAGRLGAVITNLAGTQEVATDQKLGKEKFDEAFEESAQRTEKAQTELVESSNKSLEDAGIVDKGTVVTEQNTETILEAIENLPEKQQKAAMQSLIDAAPVQSKALLSLAEKVYDVKPTDVISVEKGTSAVVEESITDEVDPIITPVQVKDLSIKSQDIYRGLERLRKQQTEQNLTNTINELDASEAGKRVPIKEDGVVVRHEKKKSTFPKWLPAELRSKKLIDRVLADISANDVPKTGTKAKDLYDVIQARSVDTLADMKSDPIFAEEFAALQKEIAEVKKTKSKKKKTTQYPTKGNASIDQPQASTKAPTDGVSPTTFDTSTAKSLTEDLEADIDSANLPALLEFYKQITDQYPSVSTRMTSALGVAMGKDIKISAEIAGNPVMAAKVLAHEIGHVMDYLPNKSMSQGNIIGRIASIRNYTKKSFEGLNNTDITNELKVLTKMWRPFDENIDTKYTKYRYSSVELYADAISVLFNNQPLLKAKAPLFYDAFFEFIDKKPEIKTAFFEVADLLQFKNRAALRERVLQRNLQEEMRGKSKRQQIELEGVKESPQNVKEILATATMGFKQAVVSKNSAVLKQMADMKKEGSISMSQYTDLRSKLERLKFVDNDIHLWTNKYADEILTPLEAAGIKQEDMSALLKLESYTGARKDIANPLGITPDFAVEVIGHLNDKLTQDQKDVVATVAKKFREMNFELTTRAKDSGLISKKLYNETIVPNKDTYVAHQIVDYLEQNYVSAGIKKATGTFKGAENALVTSLLKGTSLVKAIVVQETKVELSKFQNEVAKETMEPAKMKGNVAMKKEGFGIFEVHEDGVKKSYYAEPAIIAMFEKLDTGKLKGVLVAANSVNNVFKPLVTTLRLGFQLWNNPWKDNKRNVKNISAALKKYSDITNPDAPTFDIRNIGEYFKEALKSIPEGQKFAKGELTNLGQEMLKVGAITAPEISYDYFAKDDFQTSAALRKIRRIKLPSENKSHYEKVRGKVKQFIDLVSYAGSIIESSSKITAYQIVKKRTKTNEQAGYIVRNYAGTPNYRDGGNVSILTNTFFPFSNVQIQGMRSDFNLLSDRKSATTYILHTMIQDVFPAAFAAMAAYGLMGDEAERLFAGLSEYDKANYTAIPLGLDEAGNTVAIRIPHDEVGRFTHALSWKLFSTLAGKQRKTEQIGDLLGGFVPFQDLTPAYTMVNDWINYLQGENPHDSFRNRPAIDRKTWDEGGTPRFMGMLDYSARELGGGDILSLISSFDPSADRTAEWWSKRPLFNSMFKVSDYGLTEEEDAKKEELKRGTASLAESYADNYLSNPGMGESQKILMTEQYAVEVMGLDSLDELYSLKGSEKSRATKLKKELNHKIIEKQGDPLVNELLKAKNNDDKYKILEEAIKDFSYDQIVDLHIYLRDNKIVSDTVFDRLY